MQTESIEQFEESWLNHQSDSFSDRLARRSLRSLAFDVPELKAALDKLDSPAQEQLELHLEQGSVQGHAAPAESLSELFKSMAEAVKEVAKDISGRKRMKSSLMAYAPAPGSVQLLFKVPDPPNHQRPIKGIESSTSDAYALRLVTQVLASASSEQDALDSVAARLPSKGRVAIRSLSKTVAEQGWNVSGRLVARGREPQHLVFTPANAVRLEDAVSKKELRRTPVSIKGSLDGWVWSTGTLRFRPENGRAFSAYVPAKLQYAVAELVASKVEDMTINFIKVETHAPGESKAIRTSYSVDEIPTPEV